MFLRRNYQFNTTIHKRNNITFQEIKTPEELISFLDQNATDYRFYKLLDVEGKIKIGFTYYMYRILQIHKELDIENVQFTHCDIWWGLLKKIYDDKILKGDV